VDALARGSCLWEGNQVNRIALACFGSALAGSLLGAGFVAWVAQPGAAPSSPSAQARDSELSLRLASVERSLAALEPRLRLLPGRSAADTGRVEPVGLQTAQAPGDDTLVDSPVFEAAVVDIIGRAAEGRDGERAAAREDKRRKRTNYWANELTMRLGLSPAQTERLIAIQSKLNDELDRQRSTTSDGEYIPREVRKETRIALRQRAEEQLRLVLEPRQLSAYKSLDDELRLYRSKDD
jgi:hypothetical protein